jgi:solute carrier family 13 (sodium-dependent dicarboxylate transporter), member 2/3/5
LGVAFAIAMAMALPVSTPPNALAHAAGGINTGQMARIGAMIGLIGLAGAILMVAILRLLNFF